jgi:hypothetical protein
MPLRDHFRGPVSDEVDWASFHSAWANTMVRRLNERLLPPRYRSQPEVHLGTDLEIDIASFEREAAGPAPEDGNGVATAVWAPPQPTRTAAVDFPAQDLFEVRVHDRRRGMRLVAAVELASPRNKDRPESRRAFAVKCASYLQAGVSVVVVDVVTDRQADLYAEVLPLLGQERAAAWPGDPPVYAVALRTTKQNDRWRLDAWEEALALQAALPTLPLWLAADLAVPLELEATYEETCRVLRIG